MTEHKIVLIQNTDSDDGIEFQEVDILLNNAGGESLLLGASDGTFRALTASAGEDGYVVKVQSDGRFLLEAEDTPTDPTKIIADNSEVAVIDAGTEPGYIHVKIDGTNQVFFKDGSIEPVTHNDIDLGATGKMFSNLYIAEDISDGTYSVAVVQMADAVSKAHTQNTDTGTTESGFIIDSDHAVEASRIMLKNNSGTLEVYRTDAAAYMDFEAKDAQFATVSVTGGDPTADDQLARKAYVDSLLGANDAMLFKGTIGTGGTYTKATFEALTAYETGWTFKVTTAETLAGKACEIGDMIIAVSDISGGTFDNDDWTVIQQNIDGAVTTEETSTSGDELALYSGTSGKVIKKSTVTIDDVLIKGSITAANSLLIKNDGGTIASLPVTSGSVVGRRDGANDDGLEVVSYADLFGDIHGSTNASYPSVAANDSTFVQTVTTDGRGHISGVTTHELTPADLGAMPAWVTAPASAAATGTAGQIAYDDDYLYICVGTDSWKRTTLATWS